MARFKPFIFSNLPLDKSNVDSLKDYRPFIEGPACHVPDSALNSVYFACISGGNLLVFISLDLVLNKLA